MAEKKSDKMSMFEIRSRIEAVCRTLDTITVTGIQNAGNLTGCYSILNDILFALKDIPMEEEEKPK